METFKVIAICSIVLYTMSQEIAKFLNILNNDGIADAMANISASFIVMLGCACFSGFVFWMIQLFQK